MRFSIFPSRLFARNLSLSLDFRSSFCIINDLCGFNVFESSLCGEGGLLSRVDTDFSFKDFLNFSASPSLNLGDSFRLSGCSSCESFVDASLCFIAFVVSSFARDLICIDTDLLKDTDSDRRGSGISKDTVIPPVVFGVEVIVFGGTVTEDARFFPALLLFEKDEVICVSSWVFSLEDARTTLSPSPSFIFSKEILPVPISFRAIRIGFEDLCSLMSYDECFLVSTTSFISLCKSSDDAIVLGKKVRLVFIGLFV
mmetsp:Transcript_1950/g.2755  ORF Transcript_1950/g.2755 Transcript_1950/m.2755 type:complete len:255 (-) Transcript_1950:767-1531(-)